MSARTKNPSISRIYDYVLGGHNNFEADCLAATELFKSNNAEIFPRDETTIRSLCEPWEIITLKPLSEWLDVGYLMQESDCQYNTEFYGILLEHAAV